MTSDGILTRLAELSKLIESHKAAIFLLERERDALYGKLCGAGWTPPETAAAPARR